DRLVLVHGDAAQDAGGRRRDLRVHLVRRHLKQRLVRRDVLALFLQPAGDRALGDALTELGHYYGDRHVRGDSLGVEVQWLASERQVRLADDLRLGRVRVNEGRDVVGLRVPVENELGLGDQLADPAADQVDAQDPSRLAAGRGRRLGDHL